MAVLSNICTVIAALCKPVSGVFARLADLTTRVTTIESSLPIPNPMPVDRGGTGGSTVIAARAGLNIPTVDLLTGSLISLLNGTTYIDSLTTSKAYTFANVTDSLGCTVLVENPTGFSVTWPGTVVWPEGPPASPSVGFGRLYCFVVVGGTVFGTYMSEHAL